MDMDDIEKKLVEKCLAPIHALISSRWCMHRNVNLNYVYFDPELYKVLIQISSRRYGPYTNEQCEKLYQFNKTMRESQHDKQGRLVK